MSIPVEYGGSTCERIKSEAECNEAARQLGLQVDGLTPDAMEETSSDFPPYCYFHNAEALQFNKNGNSASQCDYDNVCICKKTSGK